MNSDSIYNFFGGSLIKALSAVFLFVVCMAAVGLYIYEVINNLPVNDIVRTILDVSISFSLTVLGVNQGSHTANETFNKIMAVPAEPPPSH